MSGKTLGEIMSEKTLEGINNETPDMPGYYSDAIEYLDQIKQTLPDKFDQVLPVQTVSDIFESDFIASIVLNTMSIEDCKKLVSYAKRFQVFTVLIEHFIKENKLPNNNVTLRFIAMYIIEAMIAFNQDYFFKVISVLRIKVNHAN